MLSRRTKSSRNRLAFLVTIGLLVAVAAGCTYMPGRLTPFAPPTELAHLRLEGRDSASLILDRVWLERHDGRFFVKGYVMPKLGVRDTMGSHVIISLRDANGAELRLIGADFHPRQIPVRTRMPHAVGTYTAQLDPLPQSTAIIVVSANDDRPGSSPQERR